MKGLNSLEIRSDEQADEGATKTLRVGEAYPVYEDEDEMPDMARIFYGEVAAMADIKIATLVHVVAVIEKQKLIKQKWKILDGNKLESDEETEDGIYMDHRTREAKQSKRAKRYV